MISLPQASRLTVIALAVHLACGAGAARAEDKEHTPCTEDAMLVFDASGSMAGNGWGYGSENPTAVSRLERVQRALSKILPAVTRFRRVGLITYGTGAYNQCNVQLQFPPAENASDRILATVRGLVPTARTPLSMAVEQAAEVLDYRQKPGIVVLLTARRPAAASLANSARGCMRRPSNSPSMSSVCV